MHCAGTSVAKQRQSSCCSGLRDDGRDSRDTSYLSVSFTGCVAEDGPRGAELPGQPAAALRSVLTGRTLLAQRPSHRFRLRVLCLRALQSPGGGRDLRQPRGRPVHQVRLLLQRVGPVPGAAGSRLSSVGLPRRQRQLRPERRGFPLEPLGLPPQLQPLCALRLPERRQLAARAARRRQPGALPGRREESAVRGGALPVAEEQLRLRHVRDLHRRGLVREGPGGGLAPPAGANRHPGLRHPEEGRVVPTDPDSRSERPLLPARPSLGALMAPRYMQTTTRHAYFPRRLLHAE